ncbi:aldo/keto reductase [Streptomyces mirabilis]|uniref:aldo/keto reductase n=1 Tax=Streptomyces mirabilis TaxID=68239 RepID=UPI003CCF01B0
MGLHAGRHSAQHGGLARADGRRPYRHAVPARRGALDELLPACTDRGVSVLAASVFNSGLLATARPAEGATFDYAPAAPRTLERAHRIADVCDTHGVTLPELAMAFPLRHPAVSGIVVGMRTADEVRRNMAAFGPEIPAQVWDDLRSEGLLDERAPVHV